MSFCGGLAGFASGFIRRAVGFHLLAALGDRRRRRACSCWRTRPGCASRPRRARGRSHTGGLTRRSPGMERVTTPALRTRRPLRRRPQPARRRAHDGAASGPLRPASDGRPARPRPRRRRRPGPCGEPLPGVVHVPDWLDLDAQRALVADFRRWAPPPGRAAPPAGADRPPDERAVGVPRLALAAVRLQPHRRRHRRRAGQAAARRPRRAGPAARSPTRTAPTARRRRVRTRRRDRQPLRAGRPPRPAPGRRGAVRRARS